MGRATYTEMAVRGKVIRVPSTAIDGRTVVATGSVVRFARILDEEFVEHELIQDPDAFIAALNASGLRADVLEFPQKLYESAPKYALPFEWDNAAVAKTKNFDDWWTGLPQESRKNVRRAAKRGVVVERARFNAEFVRGIKGIYDEMPVRQGRRFWHFGKALETVEKENSSYVERSEFLGAYCDGELIGFMKFVYVDQVANMMQILSKASHYDKRPMNALIAKAVEVCAAKGVSYLAYSKYTYGNKDESNLSAFKRRNGFVQMDFPRYFVPLTPLGRVFVGLKLHRGLLGLLPSRVISLLWHTRAAVLQATRKP